MGIANSIKPKRHLFGTDGVRGIADQDPMTSEMALKPGPRDRQSPA